MGKVQIKNNKDKVLASLFDKEEVAMEMCGLVAEGFAAESVRRQGAVDTGRLMGSVTHKVGREEGTITAYVGTNVEYAPFVEFGTGIYYSGGRRTSWTYQDGEGEWHKTNGMRPRPFIRPAVADHQKDYKKIIEDTLKG